MFSVAADVRNLLGECPLWCERTRRLYWTDIEGRELLALEEDDNVVMRWPLPEHLGSFAFTEKADVLLSVFHVINRCFHKFSFVSSVNPDPSGKPSRSGI